MSQITQDLHVKKRVTLPSQKELSDAYPVELAVLQSVAKHREEIEQILLGEDDRMIVLAGGCSERSVDESVEIAEALSKIQARCPRLKIVKRTCPDKPRTTIGWPGIADDPNMDGSYEMWRGLYLTREIFTEIAKRGVAIGTEVMGPFTIDYVSDVTSYAWIGARSVTEPLMRKVASGLSMPVGNKNSPEGSIKAAVEAVETERHPHWFKGVDEIGRLAKIETSGNPFGHVILRGGSKPNYGPEDIQEATSMLAAGKLLSAILVDVAHGNSNKDPVAQAEIAKSVFNLRKSGATAVKGVIVEVDIKEGRVKDNDLTKRERGLSVTDPCMSLDRFAHLADELNTLNS